MNARPRNPEPIAGQPHPRTIRPHWIDRTTYIIGLALLGAMLAITMFSASEPHTTPAPMPNTNSQGR